MPLTVPHLDDRTFEQLVIEGRSLIPRYSREWTNHNPSDPGITLLELFAWLTEAAIFQLDQIPAVSIEQFLKLLSVCREGTAGQQEAIDQTMARALGTIKRVTRAITVAEFEALAKEVAEKVGTRLGRTAFALYRDTACAPADHPEQAPLAVLVIVVPDTRDSPTPMPGVELTDAIFRELARHRVLTTRLHVVGPQYVEVNVETTLVRKPGSGLTSGDVERVLRDFLHPLHGGTDGQGWPFGRAVYYSEMFQRLEGLPRVDHVAQLRLRTKPPGTLLPAGVDIPAQALVLAADINVTVQD
jgi:hypothetical protein